jgi:hypothetical protein
MLINLRFDSKSPFLPELQIPIFVATLDKERSRLLHRMVLQKEKWILENTVPYPENDDKDWLTNRLYGYNVFKFADEYPVVNDFKQFIRACYLDYCASLNIKPEKVYIQCWANILRNNKRGITEHNHADGHADSPLEYSYVSGSICLNDLNTHTSFRSPLLKNMYQDIRNYTGENIMFPSYVLHKTDINTAPIPRISIAYDIITQEQYDLARVRERKDNFVLLSE